MKYYLLDENKNLVEGFDKEGFLALLEQAIERGSLENIDEDSAVASKIRSVLNGTTHHIEFVTQDQYNQLVASEELVANTYYFITDDTTAEDLENHITENDARMSALEKDYIEYKQELHDVVGDLAWNKVGDNVSEFDLVSGKTYFVRVKGEGYATPSFDQTMKYYGSFVISNFSKSYETIGGIIQQSVRSGDYYGISVGGNLAEKDETEIVMAASSFSKGVSVKLTAHTDKMDVYILN